MLVRGSTGIPGSDIVTIRPLKRGGESRRGKKNRQSLGGRHGVTDRGGEETRGVSDCLTMGAKSSHQKKDNDQIRGIE